MSVSSGFFNSLDGDRKYTAEQMSAIFDGLIIDGIFASVGQAFAVSAGGGLVVTVGTGKAWFDHTWTVNDASLRLTAPDSDILLDRIDAVVLEVNRTESVRANSIKFISGEPASSPVNPTLTDETYVRQIPLCYIYRGANTTEIAQANITSVIGTDAAPFVTGILQVISLDTLLGQWQDNLDQFVASEKKDFTDWFDQMKADLLAEQATLDSWIASEQSDFLEWYNRMKDQLTEDAAGSLQTQMDREAIRRILSFGFEDGVKILSEDGTQIVSTASDGRKLVKTFTDEFHTATCVLTDSNEKEIARSVRTFSTDGLLISTVITYS